MKPLNEMREDDIYLLLFVLEPVGKLAPKSITTSDCHWTMKCDMTICGHKRRSHSPPVRRGPGERDPAAA